MAGYAGGETDAAEEEERRASLQIASSAHIPPPGQEEEGGGGGKQQQQQEESPAPGMLRILAKVVRLDKVTKHPLAENLNVAHIGGWRVVVAPDETTGTLGVFFEIDSILPTDSDWVRSLRMPSKSSLLVKSIKIRGLLSQGLFVSMKKLPLKCSTPADEEKWLQHPDVTDLLHITKREDFQDVDPDSIQDTVDPKVFRSKLHIREPRILFGDVFPDGPSKTDELRVQSFMELLGEMISKPYYITLKIDGMSATYGYDEKQDRLCACSRNYLVDLDETLIGAVGKMYQLQDKLSKHPNLVIQAEVYGPKVNKNLMKVPSHRMAVFNVYDKERRERLPFAEMKAACKMLGVPMVPVEEVGDNFQYTFEELLEKAKGFYPGTKHHREGLVVRYQQQYGDSGYLSFKVLNNDYLLKHGQ